VKNRNKIKNWKSCETKFFKKKANNYETEKTSEHLQLEIKQLEKYLEKLKTIPALAEENKISPLSETIQKLISESKELAESLTSAQENLKKYQQMGGQKDPLSDKALLSGKEITESTQDLFNLHTGL